MKKAFLYLLVTIAILAPAAAQSNLDWVKWTRSFTIPEGNQLFILVTGHSGLVYIIQDTANYIEAGTSHAVDTASFFSTDLGQAGICTLGQAVPGWVHMHIVSYKFVDYIALHLDTRRIDVQVMADNLVYLSANNRDFDLDYLKIVAEDKGMVKIHNRFTCKELLMVAEDYGFIRYGTYDCPVWLECERDYGTVRGSVRNGEKTEYLESGMFDYRTQGTGYDPLYTREKE